MKKNIMLGLLILLNTKLNAQVSINNTTPKSTFDIMARTSDGSTPEGIIAPRLTGEQIKAGDINYTTEQTGNIIYATTAVGIASTKTINITSPGYYYFDGAIWQKFEKQMQGTSIPTVVAAGQASNSFTQADHSGYSKWIFTASLNDGNWSSINNSYTIPKDGFYQFSLDGKMNPSTTNNSFAWNMKYGSILYTFSKLDGGISTSSYHKGGIVTLYALAGTIFEFGGFPCMGCTSTYTISNRSFSIIYLGGGS
ncbi:hypothetical protein [Chryseobacterium fistulae]|uniref:C1q domain-containing protein n=1 Tax=Chryseobacterium fistulae TaxID=2675058 RepID=A0A6N4XWJ8_9FLAO|nr:hypothetical protein [Chryseobacterium fistulae]CAA7390979.1 hypothetical protein CHRY9393_02822 [Chryseobacterium fistulae]